MEESRLDYYDEENGDLFRTIEGLENVGSVPKKVIMFLEDHQTSFLELVESWLPEKYEGTEVKDVAETEDYAIKELIIENNAERESEYYCPTCAELIDLEELLEDGMNSKIYLIFAKDDEEHFFFLITNEGSTDLERDLNFFNSLYPFVSRVGFRSRELHEILERLDDKNMDVDITDYVAKRYYNEERTDERHQLMNVDEAFESAKKANTWIDSIAAKVDDKNLRLARSGKIQYGKDFDFSDIYHRILVPIIRDNVERYNNVLKDRSRTEEESEVKPIIFETVNAIFPSEENGKELVNTINSLDHFEVALLSEDRSMPEIMVKDYYSGASYLVDVIGNDEILISPQTGVRELSLNSLINRISARYDGEVNG